MKDKTWKKWTTEEDLVISSMRAEGKPSKEIAEKLGRSYYSVTNRINTLIQRCELSKQPGKKTVVDYDEVAKRVSANPGNIQKVFREYAEEAGISVHTVHGAYYHKKPNRIRIKDRGKLFTTACVGGFVPMNHKNTNKPVIKCSIWSKIKRWLLTSLPS